MRARKRSRALASVELRDCSVRLGRHWALRDVSFLLRTGERWLLLGPNGAGKTVLLKLLRGDVWPTPTGRESRRYVFADGHTDTQPLDAFDRIAYLGPEKQDRYERHDSTLTVAQVVLTGFDDSDFPLRPATAPQRRRIDEMLGRVGLRGVATRRLLTLSYGQRRRALLARALVRRPDVLLLDEALNGLDASGRRTFLRALRRALPARAAWVLTSHRRADAREVDATRLATMAHGRLELAVPVAPGTDARSGGATPICGPVSSPSHAHQPRGRRSLFRLERAAVYREGRPVIGAFDWTLVEGEHWYVRGANGSGKSTLVMLVYGDLWPGHGATLERRWAAVEDWKRRVGLVSPELQARYAATGCTVRDIVASGLHDSIGLNDVATASESRRVGRDLARWGLRELADRCARELSYGQLRLVLVARAFVRRRRLYLLDEPFDGLDAEARVRVRARLDTAVRDEGATLVIASHHVDDVPDYVRRELALRRGRAPVATVRPAALPRTRSRRRP
ncbi:MAG TPA: ATP-binding cassette domain-containing protein [Steroidobacteraceae bacterium]|nr:ATP-binding cassette domain-containing protein [Steroidobacteraceae bacterium]